MFVDYGNKKDIGMFEDCFGFFLLAGRERNAVGVHHAAHRCGQKPVVEHGLPRVAVTESPNHDIVVVQDDDTAVEIIFNGDEGLFESCRIPNDQFGYRF